MQPGKSKKKEFEPKDLEDVIIAASNYYTNEYIASKNEELEDNLQQKQIKILNGINPDYVNLNVGGKIFATTYTTLKSHHSYFEKLFTGRIPLVKDEKGNFFIDRNPNYFEYVLEFLRDGDIVWPTDKFLTQKIKREFEYFNLVRVNQKRTFHFDTEKKSPLITLTDSPMTAKKNADAPAGCSIVLGDTEFADGIWQWQVKLTNCSYWGAFGICNKAITSLEGFNYSSTPCICTDGNAYMMSPAFITALTNLDVIDFEFNADTKVFTTEIQSKNLKCTANINYVNVYPFFYLWNPDNSIELSFP